MPPIIRLITKPEQAVENAESFQELLRGPQSPAKDALVSTIPYFQSWIAVPDPATEGFLLAPSKWVGYANMTGELYAAHHQDRLDGRETEKALAPLVERASDQPGLSERLMDQLYALCAVYGKKPNGRCRISILQQVSPLSAEERSGPWVDLLVKVYQSLPVDQQHEFRRRIRA